VDRAQPYNPPRKSRRAGKWGNLPARFSWLSGTMWDRFPGLSFAKLRPAGKCSLRARGIPRGSRGRPAERLSAARSPRVRVVRWVASGTRRHRPEKRTGGARALNRWERAFRVCGCEWDGFGTDLVTIGRVLPGAVCKYRPPKERRPKKLFRLLAGASGRRTVARARDRGQAPRRRGSSTSRSASPSMLNPKTASEIATPGQMAIQGARNM
jgi:hypothetical protein